jgi:hypothetical protein
MFLFMYKSYNYIWCKYFYSFLEIKRSPYEAIFGTKTGLANSIIPKNILPNLQTEENLEGVFTQPNSNSIEVVKINGEIGVVKEPVEVEGTKETEDNKITDLVQKI